MKVVDTSPLSLIATNVTESGAVAWSPSFSYTEGERVLYQNAIYERLVDEATPPTWSGRKLYNLGATVTWGGSTYSSLADTKVPAPVEGAVWHKAYTQETDVPDWLPNHTYLEGDCVKIFVQTTELTQWVLYYFLVDTITGVEVNYKALQQIPVWADTLFYVGGHTIMYAGQAWKCLQSITLLNPSLDTERWKLGYLDPSVSPQWIKVSVSNQLKAIDENIYTQTERNGTITYVIQAADTIDTICLFGVDADNVVVKVNDQEPETKRMLDGVINNWYAYFYTPYRRVRRSVAVFTTPVIAAPIITITLSKYDVNDPVRIGKIVCGKGVHIGKEQFGARGSIHDWSKKEFDAFGNLYLSEGHYANKLSTDVIIPSTRCAELRDFFASIRAQPRAFVRDDDYQQDFIAQYGICRNFEVVLNNGTQSAISLEIDSIT